MPQIDRLKYYRRWTQLRSSDFEDPNVPEQYPPDVELEPVHLDINLRVDLAEESVTGEVVTTVVARHDGLSALELDAVDFLDLAVEGRDGHDVSWSYDGRKIKIHWANPLSAGEQRRAAVNYKVVKPVDGLYFSQPDEAYPDRSSYVASDHETERARHWLPCIDLPNVRTTLDIRLRAEDRFTILANGLLLDETRHRDGTKTAHWRLEQRCPSYLICFAIGDFVRADDGYFDDGEKQIELAYFSNREHDKEALLRSFGRTGTMMAWMTDKLDMPFPYPKYFQFSLPAMRGAMENISLVSWGDWAVLSEETAEEESWIIDLINLHEMAHSYFGDAVVIRDFAHAWLKESWATYMEQCWAEDVFGTDHGEYIFYEHSQDYFKEAEEKYKRPIVSRRFRSSWQMYDKHLYPGGACRLHTLRCELGDQVFWSAAQDYLKRYSGQVVETDDFRHVMEQHSGRSLGKFFDQWFHSQGYPDIKVTFKYDEKQKQGTFEVEQQQVNVEKGVPAFELATALGWTINGQMEHMPVKLSEAKHIFVIPIDTAPEQVRFDPTHKILHKLSFNPGDPMLKKQLQEAKDVIGRIQAAHELAKTGKRSNIQAVIDAFASEPFWRVRVEFAKALSKAGSASALVGLAQIIADENHPAALPLIFQAAAEYRHDGIREAIAGRLADGLRPYSRAAAFEVMGAQRKKADWDILLEGSREAGYHDIARSGALRALGDTRRERAADLLLDKVGYGVLPSRARPAAISGLADVGKGLEKAKRDRVAETLQDMLRDPELGTQYSAAHGLVEMLAVEAIPALEAFSRSQSRQKQVYFEKLVDTLRDHDKSDGSALKKQVEDLNEKVRKLDEQLQRLQAQLDTRSSRDSE